MKKKWLLISLIVSLLTGCATPYQGRLPNFDLHDRTAVDREIQEFTLNDSFWTAGYFFRMNGAAYTVASMKPMLGKISHRAWEATNAAEDWRTVQQVSAVVSLVGLAGWLLTLSGNSDLKTPSEALFFGGSGFSIASGLVGAYKTAKAGEYFNEDLRARFRRVGQGNAPHIKLAFSW